MKVFGLIEIGFSFFDKNVMGNSIRHLVFSSSLFYVSDRKLKHCLANCSTIFGPIFLGAMWFSLLEGYI